MRSWNTVADPVRERSACFLARNRISRRVTGPASTGFSRQAGALFPPAALRGLGRNQRVAADRVGRPAADDRPRPTPRRRACRWRSWSTYVPTCFAPIPGSASLTRPATTTCSASDLVARSPGPIPSPAHRILERGLESSLPAISLGVGSVREARPAASLGHAVGVLRAERPGSRSSRSSPASGAPTASGWSASLPARRCGADSRKTPWPGATLPLTPTCSPSRPISRPRRPGPKNVDATLAMTSDLTTRCCSEPARQGGRRDSRQRAAGAKTRTQTARLRRRQPRHQRALSIAYQDEVAALFAAAHRHPRMRAIYDEYLARSVDRERRRTLAHYNSSADGRSTACGARVLEYVSQDPAEAPKYQALLRRHRALSAIVTGAWPRPPGAGGRARDAGRATKRGQSSFGKSWPMPSMTWSVAPGILEPRSRRAPARADRPAVDDVRRRPERAEQRHAVTSAAIATICLAVPCGR